MSYGCFYGKGGVFSRKKQFNVAPKIRLKHLETLLQQKVSKTLFTKGKIILKMISMLLS
jgi:hypothetical protein